MRKEIKLGIAYSGIGTSVLYGLVVAGYFILGTSEALTCWEVVTIISALVILVVLLSILEHTDEAARV